MSTETEVIDRPNAGTEIPGEGAPASRPVEPSAEAPERSDVETRARAMGWVGREEYRGPAENWRDADEFVKHGEEALPVLRERNRDLARRHAELEARIARQEQDFQARVARQEHMARLALYQQRQSIEASYEAAKRQAVELGDTGRYEQLSRDQRTAVGQFDQQVTDAAQPPPQAPTLAPHIATEVSQWTAANDWFHRDPVMNQTAQAIHMHLNQTQPGLSVRDNLAMVAREIRQRFPEKFGNGGSTERRAAAVEGGGGGMPAAGRRARGVADLPPEARRDGQSFISAGAFKNMDEFAKSYWQHNP